MKMWQVTSTFFLLFSMVATNFITLFTSSSSCSFTLQGFSLTMQFLRNLMRTFPSTGASLCDWIIFRSLCISSMLGSLETTGLQMLVSGLEQSGHLLVFLVSSGSACGYLFSTPTYSSASSSSDTWRMRLSMLSLIFFSCCLSLTFDSSIEEVMEGRLWCVYLNDWFSISMEMLVYLKKVRAVLQMRVSPSLRLASLNRLSCSISARSSFMLISLEFQQQNWQQQIHSLLLGSRESVSTFWQQGQAKQKVHLLFFTVFSYMRLHERHWCEENSGTVQQWQQQLEQLMQVYISSWRMRRLHLHYTFTWGYHCSGWCSRWMPVSVSEYIVIFNCQRKYINHQIERATIEESRDEEWEREQQGQHTQNLHFLQDLYSE